MVLRISSTIVIEIKCLLLYPSVPKQLRVSIFQRLDLKNRFVRTEPLVVRGDETKEREFWWFLDRSSTSFTSRPKPVLQNIIHVL